jgi:ubiquinone/menaquinone biosynthesis C-methylase UbiE
MKNTERFTDRVANYVLYRPHYPQAVVSFLQSEIGLKPGWKVADIGSGTGISSMLFLDNGNTVFAVEPNNEMRQAAVSLLGGNNNFNSINGTAEQTTLQDNSVNLVVAGQAFHWFDPVKAKREFKRIALPGAYVALIWNERRAGTGFEAAYEALLHQYAPAYAEVGHRHISENIIKDFFAPAQYKIQQFDNAQYFDFESLKGRMLSSSYAPLENHPNHAPLVQHLKVLFDEYNASGKVEFGYDCKVYYGLFN